MESKLDLIKREVEAFQILRTRKHLSCEKCNCDCEESALVGKLMTILKENAEEGEPKSLSSSSSVQIQAQASPEQKAFSNSAVVKNILSWMNPHTLLEFRKVSKLWREEADSILLSRPAQLFCVEFTKRDNFENFTHNAGTLSLFMEECLRHSEIFPCSQFVFNRGRLSDPNLLLFFSKYGRHVEHLGLNPEVVDLTTLRYILLKWTPNLKSLTFQPTSWAEGRHLVERKTEGSSNSLPPSLVSQSELENAGRQPLALPKLRAITLPKTNSTSYPPGAGLISEILTSASNLTSIEDPHLSYILQMAAAKKLGLMTTLKWDFEQNEGLALNFHRFVALGPRLKSMNLQILPCHKNIATCSAVSTLFRSSQNNLENITDIQNLDFSDSSQTPSVLSKIPPLPEVTHLEVWKNAGSVFRVLPEGQSVSEIFPNLKSMHVRLRLSGLGGTWKDPPSSLRFSAHILLEKLKISESTAAGELTYDWVQPIHSLYPNIKQLHVVLSDSGLKNLPEGLRKIPTFFQKLEQLFIEIEIERDLPNQFKVQMDQALTGLPTDLFGRLWNSREPDVQFQKPQVLEQVRNAPSILDLKQLTNLTFQVRFKQRAKPLWSYMAQFYAFQPMAKRQGLEVNVRGVQSAVPLKRSDLGPL